MIQTLGIQSNSISKAAVVVVTYTSFNAPKECRCMYSSPTHHPSASTSGERIMAQLLHLKAQCLAASRIIGPS